MAVVASLWQRALERLGWVVTTVDGRDVAGLAWPITGAPTLADVRAAIDGVDLVIVENVCSLPLHPVAAHVVARALRGRRAVLHHHDLPWQRETMVTPRDWPPDDPAWRHVVINELSRAQLASRGIDAVLVRNVTDVDAPRGAATVDADRPLLLHPVRAIERKDVPAAIRLTEALDGTYWLTGPAEEGYELGAVLARARCPVRHEPVTSMADAYASSDAVLLPSRWEGFGQPLLEAAVHRRPIAVAPYPVAEELRRFGFRWFPTDSATALRSFLVEPDELLHDHNESIVREHFSLERLETDLAHLLDW